MELSNNLAENSMRPAAIGRRNWIHVGSPQAQSKIAAILSALEGCRRLKISVRDYLARALPGLADLRSNAFQTLLRCVRRLTSIERLRLVTGASVRCREAFTRRSFDPSPPL